ncbi:hypothetical protein [uncultured Phenylobacterium sp.]|uniref:hypothetical protein n=1 Tax=uncultured Phenylobacterium sp. TaxID=349273 RepID=UPI0025D37F2B|nr:hypothetical protein [uncultured Phenylobacterium sp.]
MCAWDEDVVLVKRNNEMDDCPEDDLPVGVVRLRASANPPGKAFGRPVSEHHRRFVYDVDLLDGEYVVVFRGKVLTRHESRDAAISNARLIASNFWLRGIPTAVRVVETNGSVSPVVSFG